ncbi:hypothetical protein ABPG75_003994 [Micractinium tetrahymenae]
MPPLDVSLQDRQRAIQHMQVQLQRLQQPAEKAGSMASKVEEAAYNKATNKHEYMQFLQNSMKKAQAALHRQAHTQHQAAQHQAAQQQAHAQQQAQQQQPHAQQQAQQQQHAAMMAQQAQAQHQAVAQHHQAIAQSQAAVQAQFIGQPQYIQQQPAQPQYMQQQPAQPQYVQQQAAQQQPPMQQARPAGQPAGLQPRQLGPAEIARLPSFDDPAFGDFAAEFFPDAAQPAAAPKLQQAQQLQPPPPRYMQQQVPSVAESSAPAPGRNGAPGSAQAREVSSAAGAAGAAGAHRPQQHQHDPQALQEFVRMHAAFNNPASRAQTIKDSERMLQFYRDSGKNQPAVAERMAARVQRSGMILRLLMTEQPHQQLAITDQVVKVAKGFVRELAQFRGMVKRSSQKLANAGSGGSSAGTAVTAGSAAASPGGFLAMMESGDSDALKLSGALSGSCPSAGAAPAKLPAAPGMPAAAAPTAAGHVPPGQPSAASAAASAAAEAARQQALARQRQLAEANAEQQRRREAAAAAAAALPAAGPSRLVAAAQQARGAADVAAVQGGFRRLQKVLTASEQRLLGLSPPQGVSTPPLPDEVRRLVARERAAMEEAAAAAAAKPGGGGMGSAQAVLTAPAAEGVAAEEPQQAPRVDGEAASQPAAKRQRSMSPEAAGLAGAAQPRQRSAVELRVAAECQQATVVLGDDLLLQVAPDGTDPSCAMVTCLPRSAQAGGDAAVPGRAAGGQAVPAKHQWQVLLLRVPPGYPAEAPTAVFPRMGHGGASEATAAAAARHQQLLDACRERFAASLTGGPSPPALAQVVKAWLAATQAVAAQAGGEELV